MRAIFQDLKFIKNAIFETVADINLSGADKLFKLSVKKALFRAFAFAQLTDHSKMHPGEFASRLETKLTADPRDLGGAYVLAFYWNDAHSMYAVLDQAAKCGVSKYALKRYRALAAECEEHGFCASCISKQILPMMLTV